MLSNYPQVLKNALVAATLLATISVSAMAQGAPSKSSALKSVETKSAASRGAGDEKVMTAEAFNAAPAATRTKSFRASADKAGTAARGSGEVYVFHFDSRSDYYLSCFINGQPAGSIAPMGDLRVYVGEGVANLYCAAPGTSTAWRNRILIDSDFNWRLNP